MTDIVAPVTVPDAPPAPSRDDEAGFETRANAFYDYTVSLPSTLTTLAANVNQNATAANERATTADAAATKAQAWAESAASPGNPGSKSAKTYAADAQTASTSAQAAAAAAQAGAGLPQPLIPGAVLTAISGTAVAWQDPSAGAAALSPWAMAPVGAYFTMAPNAPLPPTDDPSYRYVILSAGLTDTGEYNAGVLTDETVTGTDPTVTASAKVTLAGSPFDGLRIDLVNTARTFLRPAEEPDVAPIDSTVKEHSHTGKTDMAKPHSHSGSTSLENPHAHQYNERSNLNLSLQPGTTVYNLAVAGEITRATSNLPAHSHSVSTAAAGAHDHLLAIDAAGSPESAPRHVGRVCIMRIL